MSTFFNELAGKTEETSFKQELEAASDEFDKKESAPVAEDPKPEPVEETAQEAIEEVQEAEQEGPAQEEPKPEHDRQVPLKALQEERQKRSELERRLQQLEAAMQRQQQPPPPVQEQPEEPDPEQDPIAALKWLKDQQSRIRQESEQRTYQEQVGNAYRTSAQQFAAAHPDFNDAYQFVINGRVAELQALGADDVQISKTLFVEEMTLADSAIQRGANPAETIYNLAKARGFTGPKPQAEKPVAAKPAPAEAAKMQEARQKVATSASAGGQAAKGGELGLEDIANLHGAAFDSAFQKYFKNASGSGMFRK